MVYYIPLWKINPFFDVIQFNRTFVYQCKHNFLGHFAHANLDNVVLAPLRYLCETEKSRTEFSFLSNSFRDCRVYNLLRITKLSAISESSWSYDAAFWQSWEEIADHALSPEQCFPACLPHQRLGGGTENPKMKELRCFTILRELQFFSNVENVLKKSKQPGQPWF